MVVVVVGQPITNPISGPSFDFTFTFGPELDKTEKGNGRFGQTQILWITKYQFIISNAKFTL